MKIIGGTLKGRNFYMPANICPTQNVIRKSIFDILGQNLEGMDFLELFAGSGAVGFEALSREASFIDIVEKDSRCFNVIKENADLLGINIASEESRNIRLTNSDAFAVIKTFFKLNKKYDVVFADPPYSRGLSRKVLKTLNAYDIFKPNCTIIIEHSKNETLPAREGRIVLFRQKQYGKSILSIYQT